MCSQAQMVSGKTILANLSVRLLVILPFFYFSTMYLRHCEFFCPFPSLFIHFSILQSHFMPLSGMRAPLTSSTEAFTSFYSFSEFKTIKRSYLLRAAHLYSFTNLHISLKYILNLLSKRQHIGMNKSLSSNSF